MPETTAKSPTQLLDRQLLLQPPSTRQMYSAVTISTKGKWDFELWVRYKSPHQGMDLLSQFEGADSEDLVLKRQTQGTVDWDEDSGFLKLDAQNVNMFPLGTVKPELQEAFLIDGFRHKILDGIGRNDWEALYWLRRHGVRISRQYIEGTGRSVWLPVTLPAIPFKTEDDLSD
jgi:hypothetical protein